MLFASIMTDMLSRESTYLQLGWKIKIISCVFGQMMNSLINYTQTGCDKSKHSLLFYVNVNVNIRLIEDVVMKKFAQSVKLNMPQDCGNVSMSID